MVLFVYKLFMNSSSANSLAPTTSAVVSPQFEVLGANMVVLVSAPPLQLASFVGGSVRGKRGSNNASHSFTSL